MSTPIDRLAFIDIETTGRDFLMGAEMWEFGAVLIDNYHQVDETYEERRVLLAVDLAYAEPEALEIGKFHDRHPQGNRFGGPDNGWASITRDGNTSWYEDESLQAGALAIAAMLDSRVLIGIGVPGFDEPFIRLFLRENGAAPSWDYHSVDLRSMAGGYLLGRGKAVPEAPPLPWPGISMARRVGVDVTDPLYARHTALGDARLNLAMWRAMTEG